MADFLWSEGAQRYRDASTGRFVAQASVNDAVDTVIRSAQDRIINMTERLQTGSLSLADWQTAMAAELKPLLVGSAAVGRGGWAQMSQSDWGWTGYQLRRQYGFLRNFAHDIATGQQPMDGRLLARAGMYPEAARGIQREMQRRTATIIGREQERNVLGFAEHCTDCLSASARGWVPIGSLPPIGGRRCRSRCHCYLQFREQPAPRMVAA